MKEARRHTRGVVPLCLLVCAFGPFGSSHAQEGDEPIVLRGAVTSAKAMPVQNTVTIRDLPPAAAWKPGQPIKEIPRKGGRPSRVDPDAQANARAETARRDPLLERQAAADQASVSPPQRTFDTPGLDLAGLPFSGVQPPDTVGDVGMNYYVQGINGADGTIIAIYNKADGSAAVAPFQLDSLGTGNCANGLGDPIVLYDQLADRWLLSEFSASANRLCVYVSRTADLLTTPWNAYEFTTPSFPDYPKYAVWPDAYFVGANQTGNPAYALDRAAMLAGNPATIQRFTTPDLSAFGFQLIQPADLDGATAPPAASPGIFVRHRDDEAHDPGSNDPSQDFLELFEFSVDFATPANSTLTGPVRIPIAEIDSELCGFVSFNCFPQPGTSTQLDPLREVVMHRLVYRNFGTHETLVGNLVTDVDGTNHGGIRWFELRRVGSGSWTLFQEGTYAPDGDSRFMGSIAMDGDQNIAVGYSVTSSTTFPSMRYAGRLAGDPPGTLPQGEHTIIAGTGSNSSNRWGDYSAMSIDPADDCTFWHTNEYGTSSGRWATRIASFRFDACGEPEIDVQRPAGNSIADGGVDPQGSVDLTTGPVTITYTVENTGTGPLDVSDIAGTILDNVVIDDITPTSFTVAAGGGSATFDVTYTVQTAGAFDATFVVTNDDADEGDYAITFSGTGTGQPEIDIQRPVGTSIADGGIDAQDSVAAGSPVTVLYTVENTGSDTLVITSITGSSASNVSIDGISPTSFSVPAGGGTATFLVDYTVTAAGVFVAELDITSNDADEGNYDITLTGTGSEPEAPPIPVELESFRVEDSE